MMIRPIAYCLLVFIVATWLPLHCTHAQTVTEAENARTVQALFVILGDPESIDFDRDTLERLLEWSSLPHTGAVSRTGRNAEFHVMGTPQAGRAVVAATVWHALEDPDEIAKLPMLAQDHVRKFLAGLHETRRKSQDDALVLASMRANQAARAVEELSQRVQQLRKKAIELGVTPGSVDTQLAGLQKSLLEINVESVGLDARREAIAERIVVLRDQQAAKQAGPKRVLDEFETLVKIRLDQYARVQELHKTGTIPTSEVQKAEYELAKARADIENQRHQFDQEADTEALSLLNQQLADTQIAAAQKQAERAVLERMLAELQSDEVRDTVDAYDRALRQLESAVDEERLAAKQLSELRMQRDTLQSPRVLLIPQGLPEEKPKEK